MVSENSYFCIFYAVAVIVLLLTLKREGPCEISLYKLIEKQNWYNQSDENQNKIDMQIYVLKFHEIGFQGTKSLQRCIIFLNRLNGCPYKATIINSYHFHVDGFFSILFMVLAFQSLPLFKSVFYVHIFIV